MKRLSLLALPLLALALSSCGIGDEMSHTWSGMWNSSNDNSLPSASGPSTTSGCPQVAVIRDLSVYQNPPAGDENNLVLTARMGHVRGGCSANAAGVAVDAMIDIVAMKGRASSSTHASLPFFVSVLDKSDNVILKKIYEVPVDFENGAQESRISSPIQPQFTIKPGEDGAGYRVLIGFHLNPAQVDANSRFFGNTTPAQ